ncbi:MAG: SprT-like family protein [Oscillospiraceae bacterium]|nr:SprT-like family protein [Oscillospiraceae bacterium]
MKKLTKYNRVAGYLNSLYDKINADFFNNELQRPVITIQSTPRAYGHFTLYNAWNIQGEGTQELNIGAGTLNRPIEYIIATLIHEMCHQHNAVNNIQDCSRGGTYHNKFFKQSAETHGLTVSRSEKYGWSDSLPSDELLDWILQNDLTDIDMNRNEYGGICIGGGSKTANGGADSPPRQSHSRRYVCPSCRAIVRATKAVNVICGDCLERMVV